MTKKLPRHSKATTAHMMRTLATAKMIRDMMAPAEKQAKAYLAQKEMEPGDRRTVTSPGGEDIGTISMTKGSDSTEAFEITDAAALAAWCDERGIHHGGKPTIAFPEWFEAPANLEALVRQAGGELPRGLGVTERPGKNPYVVVRQSESQAETLRSEFTTARGLLEAVSPALLEEGKTNE